MDYLHFVTSITSSLAWPTVALISVLLVRRPMMNLLGPDAVTKLSLTGSGFEVTRELRQAITRSSEIVDGSSAVREAMVSDTDPPGLAQINPLAAILTSAGRFEGELRDLVTTRDDLRMGLSHAVGLAIEKGLWDDGAASAAREVVRIRDTVVLTKGALRLQPADALRYERLTSSLINQAAEGAGRSRPES